MTWLPGVFGPFWTEERTAELIRLCGLGERYSVMGKALGCSRNAAIGKARRMGLDSQRTAADPRGAPKAPVKRSPMAGYYNKRPFMAEKPLPPPKPISVNDASFARPWLERLGGQCAYPIQGIGADVWSCCAATGDAAVTYCATHRAAMFAKAPTKAQIEAARKMREAKARQLMKPSQRARAA